jgi:hypothetical protein
MPQIRPLPVSVVWIIGFAEDAAYDGRPASDGGMMTSR